MPVKTSSQLPTTFPSHVPRQALDCSPWPTPNSSQQALDCSPRPARMPVSTSSRLLTSTSSKPVSTSSRLLAAGRPTSSRLLTFNKLSIARHDQRKAGLDKLSIARIKQPPDCSFLDKQALDCSPSTSTRLLVSSSARPVSTSSRLLASNKLQIAHFSPWS